VHWWLDKCRMWVMIQNTHWALKLFPLPISVPSSTSNPLSPLSLNARLPSCCSYFFSSIHLWPTSWGPTMSYMLLSFCLVIFSLISLLCHGLLLCGFLS
jgi:hypothetical protein